MQWSVSVSPPGVSFLVSDLSRFADPRHAPPRGLPPPPSARVTDDHLEVFIANKTQKVYLAYDRDKAGDRAAERDAKRLQSHGIECFRIRFPAGMDANEYALKVTPAR